MTESSQHHSPPWGTTTKAIVAVVALLLTAILIWRFRDLLTPLIIAALLAYILNPLISFIDARTRLTRAQTVLTVYLILALIVLSGSAAIGFVAVDQVLVLSDAIPRWTAQAIALLPELPGFIPARWEFWGFEIDLMPLQAQVQAQFDAFLNRDQIDWRAIATQVFNIVEPVFSRGGSLAATVVQATVSVLGLMFLVFVISIYMASDAPRFSQAISNVAHQPGYRQDADRLKADISRVWAAYLRGQVVLALVIFVVVSVSLGILGVNNALGLGLLSGIMEFLPVIGPLIGTGAAILVALFQQNIPWGLAGWQFALIVTAVMFLIQQLENNILVPRIVGDALDLHPLLVMVSVIMGASLAGLLGAVLAAPVVASVKILGGYAWRKLLDLPPFPDEPKPAPPVADISSVSPRLRAAWQWTADRVGRLLPDYPNRRALSVTQEKNPMNEQIYPLQFAPVFKDYPWGGRNLERILGRSIPDGIVAESWEISAHPNGQTRVIDGSLAGLTLAEVQERLGEDLLGSRNRPALELKKFPLLIKLLDANQWLSVQVHPDDAYGLAHEGEYGKTEMWVVIHAEPGAELIYGLKAGADRDSFVSGVEAGNSERLLHRVPVRAGDVVFVPAGAIHSLGPGIMVAEIQQNSDTTYRIYDWGRLGNDGNPRPLHVAQALDVIDWGQIEPGTVTPRLLSDGSRGLRHEVIGESPYFRTERLAMNTGSSYADRCAGESFQIWAVLSGQATLTWTGGPRHLSAISWVLLPAALGEFQIHADVDSVLLRVITPEPSEIGRTPTIQPALMD
ncbi:MAG: AI-2E family transporter [Caldilineaceae bacterium]|nr:AI-2E family transporter [Caldilineaceae bacterium]